MNIPELKGRAMARGILKAGKAMAVITALRWGLGALLGADLAPLDAADVAVAWCVLLSLTVLAAWNARAWLGDAEGRRARRLEKGLADIVAGFERERAALRVPWRPELPERLITGCDEYGRPLMRPLSERENVPGSLRYAGPPPVFTPGGAEGPILMRAALGTCSFEEFARRLEAFGTEVTRVTETREVSHGAVVTTTRETVRFTTAGAAAARRLPGR